MVEELPGFIPQVLRRDDVSLLRADETVFSAMVDGWRAQSSTQRVAPIALRHKLIRHCDVLLAVRRKGRWAVDRRLQSRPTGASARFHLTAESIIKRLNCPACWAFMQRSQQTDSRLRRPVNGLTCVNTPIVKGCKFFHLMQLATLS